MLDQTKLLMVPLLILHSTLVIEGPLKLRLHTVPLNFV